MIGAVQDWAASLDEMDPLKRASIIKKAEKNLKHRSGEARGQFVYDISWITCRTYQYSWACYEFCHNPELYDVTAAQAEVACVWANAPDMTESDIFYT